MSLTVPEDWQIRIGAAIRRRRGTMSQSVLAAQVGVNQSTVSQWELGTMALPIGSLLALERALGLEPGDLLVTAGLVADTPSVPTAIRADVSLSDDDQAVLVRLYSALSGSGG